MRLTPYPGYERELRGDFPAGDAAHLSGLPFADGGAPVARARRVKRRPREQSAQRHHFPQAMLRICPGYRSTDGGEPVAC